jgi:hypothetical protein
LLVRADRAHRFSQSTGTHWAIKTLKKADIIRVQQVASAVGGGARLSHVWDDGRLNTL